MLGMPRRGNESVAMPPHAAEHNKAPQKASLDAPYAFSSFFSLWFLYFPFFFLSFQNTLALARLQVYTRRYFSPAARKKRPPTHARPSGECRGSGRCPRRAHFDAKAARNCDGGECPLVTGPARRGRPRASLFRSSFASRPARRACAPNLV